MASQTEMSSNVISLVNVAGEVLYASASSATIFGYLPKELMGRNTVDLIHPEDRGHSRRALLMVLARPPSLCQVRVRVRRKNGEWCWVESTISNLIDEPHVGAILVNCREIEDRIEAREQQQRRRIKELKLRNARLEDSAYAVAHDFREPLRTISLFADLLMKEVGLDANGKELAQQVVDGVTRMSALFEGLHALAVSQVDATPQTVDLGTVVAEALENLGHAVTTTGAVVTVDPLPQVQGNRTNLVRVFQNLIVNAIKYRSALPIRIHVTAEPRGPDWIVKVKDNGLGIAPQYQERIFQLLTRLHGSEIPGAGIGLAICKKIVEEMGGTIWAESEVGSGSVFCFTTRAAKETAVASVIPRNREYLVSVADDVEALHQVISRHAPLRKRSAHGR